MPISQKEIEKDKKIKAEINKFKKIFKNLPEDKKVIAERLYQQAAFMLITLEELKSKVKKDGSIIETINGNGFEVKAEHPAQKSFNIMIKNYNATIKLLIDLLSETEDEKDALMEFLERDSK